MQNQTAKFDPGVKRIVGIKVTGIIICRGEKPPISGFALAFELVLFKNEFKYYLDIKKAPVRGFSFFIAALVQRFGVSSL